MVKAFIRIDLPDRSPDFQRIALEPGVPLLDRAQSTARLLRVWLGRFIAEPEWVDSQTIQFYVVDDVGRRVAPTDLRLANSRDLKGLLRSEIQALQQKLAEVQPRGRTEQAVVNLMRDRLKTLEELPEQAFSDGALFRYRDAQSKWRLVWCWGYQRSESKIVQPAICVNPGCDRIYLIRTSHDPKCTKCQTPMPVFRFPWKRVGLVTACLLLIGAAGGWRYWSTLPRSVINGQIVWSGFNVPVANADIRIESINAATRSDEQGRFQLEHLPAGTLELTVSADGFRTWKAKQELAQSQQTTVPVDLVGDGVIHGRVVDALSKQPLPNAKLQIQGTSETLTTDGKGQFHRDGCRRSKMLVQISARGYPTIEREISPADPDAPDVDLEVAGDAILVGRVISAAQQEPMADVIIRLEGSGQTVKTDAEGWYAFRSAPHGMQEVVAQRDGFAIERVEKELTSGQERQASFKLAGAAKLLGNVLRAADMSPMSGVDVKVVGTKIATKTDDDGRFEFKGLTAGKTAIEVSAPGFASIVFERELSNATEMVLPVELDGDATIVGTVTDEVTKLPIADIDVRLVGLPYTTRTNPAGKYRLEAVPSLPARIDARAAGYVAKTIDVRPTSKVETAVPLTVLGNSTISGMVTEKRSEEPVVDARISLGKSTIETKTSNEGTFEIKGVRGGVKHEVLIKADGLESHTESIDAKPGPAAPVKIVMIGAGKLTGRVVSAIDESPVPGAKIQLVGINSQVLADTKGQFEIDKLRTGRVALEVSAEGFQLRRLAEDLSTDSKPISVLLGGNATVAGEIVDAATGSPIADVEIRIAKTVLKTKTNKQGEFHLTGAFPGPAKLTATVNGYPPTTEQAELVADRETSVDFKLTGTASIGGEVFDDVGKPVPNAIVQWEDTNHKTTTGTKGEFQLDKLRGGSGTLNITAPNFASKAVPVDVSLGSAKPLGRLMLLSSLVLKGQVVNAVTGDRLANAKLSIASMGLNTTTDSQGQFKFEGLPAKSHGIKVESAGFVTEVDSVNPMNNDGTELFALCPVPKPDEVLMLLTWKGGVPDLDAHLYRAGDQAAHVFAGQPQADNLSVMKSNNNGSGPEILRIHPLKPGRYEMLVQVTGTATPADDATEALKQLSRSEAVVKVYRHGQSDPLIYQVGRNKKAQVWWPFALEIVSPVKFIDHVYKAEHYRLSLPESIGK